MKRRVWSSVLKMYNRPLSLSFDCQFPHRDTRSFYLKCHIEKKNHLRENYFKIKSRRKQDKIRTEDNKMKPLSVSYLMAIFRESYLMSPLPCLFIRKMNSKDTTKSFATLPHSSLPSSSDHTFLSMTHAIYSVLLSLWSTLPHPK